MNNSLKVVIGSFVTLLIGLVFLTSISDNVNQTQSLATISNDLFTGSNSSCVQVTSGCIDSLTSVKNASTTLSTGNYTLCQVQHRYDGIFLQTGSLYNGVALNATYESSENCMYVSNGTSRSLILLVVVLFAIGLVIAAMYYLKESDIFDHF